MSKCQLCKAYSEIVKILKSEGLLHSDDPKEVLATIKDMVRDDELKDTLRIKYEGGVRL